MLGIADVWNQKREVLKIKRDLLFKEYVSHPTDFHFALEIKTIDDEIADYTFKIDRERSSMPTVRPPRSGSSRFASWSVIAGIARSKLDRGSFFSPYRQGQDGRLIPNLKLGNETSKVWQFAVSWLDFQDVRQFRLLKTYGN